MLIVVYVTVSRDFQLDSTPESMTSQTEKAKAKLAILSSSLDDLEAHLEPLFAQTLPETVLGLEPIQQAKLQTVLPYLVYDLIFIYLKSRGIDPKTHSVVSELDRVKQYFDKITAAENPPTKRAEIDKAAAGRFIKNAITQAASSKPQAKDSASTTPEPSTSSSLRVPVKVTSKMLERQQYEKELTQQDEEGSEEEELTVFEDNVTGMAVDSSVITGPTKGKGREVPSAIQEPIPQPSGKRKRPPVDPFAGYGDDIISSAAEGLKQSNANETLSPHSSTPVSAEETKTKRSKIPAHDSVDSSGTPKLGRLTDLPASNEGISNQSSPAPGIKKAKKARKKAKKSLTTST